MVSLVNLHEDRALAYSVIIEMYVGHGVALNVRYLAKPKQGFYGAITKEQPFSKWRFTVMQDRQQKYDEHFVELLIDSGSMIHVCPY